MISNFHNYLIVLGFLISGVPSGATQEPGSQLFYKGYLDGVTEIQVTCSLRAEGLMEGFVRYLDSEKVFKLTGSIQEKGYLLRELTDEGLYCGSLELEGKDDILSGYWFNRDRTIRMPVILERTLADTMVPSGCETSHLLSVFSGILRGGRTRLQIIQAPGQALKGALFYGGMRQRWSFSEIGAYQDTFHLQMIDEGGNPKGEIFFVPNQSGDQVYITVQGLIDGRMEGWLDREIMWPGRCPGVTGFSTQYHALYYQPDDPKLRQLLENRVSEWLNEVRLKANQQSDRYTGPQDRALFRYNAWFEPVYISQAIVSGYWHHSSPEGQQIRPFNYDLSSQQELTWEVLFSSGADPKAVASELAEAALQRSQKWKDKNLIKFIKENGFSFFLLRKSGLELSTDFNAVYGRRTVMIPWDDLRGKLAVPNLPDAFF